MATPKRSNRCSATISVCVMKIVGSGAGTSRKTDDIGCLEPHTTMVLPQRQWQRLLEFLFPPETATWLAVFRVGMGLQVIVYALFLRSDWHSLFSTTGKGLVSRELGEAIASFDSPLVPKLGWLITLGQHVSLGEDRVLSIVWACLVCIGCCLLVGLFCRPAAIIA